MTQRFPIISNYPPFQFSHLRRPYWTAAVVGIFLTAGSAIAPAEEDGSTDDGDYEFVSSADIPGPILKDWSTNPSFQHYNRAVSLYLDGKHSDALHHMRAAVRAQRFNYATAGLAFSNLCMMYLKVGKYKNAQAACTKALTILPGYVPAALNLARAKKHTAPEG